MGIWALKANTLYCHNEGMVETATVEIQGIQLLLLHLVFVMEGANGLPWERMDGQWNLECLMLQQKWKALLKCKGIQTTEFQ